MRSIDGREPKARWLSEKAAGIWKIPYLPVVHNVSGITSGVRAWASRKRE